MSPLRYSGGAPPHALPGSPPPEGAPPEAAARPERSSRVLIRGDAAAASAPSPRPASAADGSLELGCPRLKKLSLHGCTRLQSVVLGTAELQELNIAGCSRLRDSALDISKCCHLQSLHMAGVPPAVQESVLDALASMEVDTSKPIVPCVYYLR